MNILISACLVGVKCNYKKDCAHSWKNGFDALIDRIRDAGINLIPVCPEQLGGLTTPRPPAEIIISQDKPDSDGFHVITIHDVDVTEQFIHGANQALHLAKVFNARIAIMEAKSPSCGSEMVHDGTFTGKLVKGQGVCANLLQNNGIKVLNEEKIRKILSGTDDASSVFSDLANL